MHLDHALLRCFAILKKGLPCIDKEQREGELDQTSSL